MFTERPASRRAGSSSSAFEERTLEGRGRLLVIDGKLRGSRARSLAERLAELAEEGVSRVVLDLRHLVSADSLGTAAVGEALDQGLAVAIVVRNRSELEEWLGLEDRGLRIHGSVEAALGERSRSGRASVAV